MRRLPTVAAAAWVLLAAGAAGCTGGWSGLSVAQVDAVPPGEPTAGGQPRPDDDSSTPPAAKSVSPMPASYQEETFVAPDALPSAVCSGAGNATASIVRVALAQTHVMAPDHPLFFLVGGRATLLMVDLAGQGGAPEVAVTARAGGQTLGRRCLHGPEALPSAGADVRQPDLDKCFRVTLPAAWLRPDLALRVEVGGGGPTLAMGPDVLKVSDPYALNMVLFQVLVPPTTASAQPPELPADFAAEIGSTYPNTLVRVGRFPLPVPLVPLATGGTASNGPVPPVVLDRRPCGGNERPSAACGAARPTDPGAMDLLGSLLRVTQALAAAAGTYPWATTYGLAGPDFDPGGWGGNKVAVGGDPTMVFVHEIGHTLDLPHWGEGAYMPADPARAPLVYPYGGILKDGGGIGQAWQYHAGAAALASPICQDPTLPQVFGRERSDAMYRTAGCRAWVGNQAGIWDGFGDFSVLAMHRYLVGAPDRLEGQVPYDPAGQAAFALGPQDGFVGLERDDAGAPRVLMPKGSGKLPSGPRSCPFFLPETFDVPVHLIYGSYHPAYPEATIVYAPLSHVGNLPPLFDPTRAADLDGLRADTSAFDNWFAGTFDLSVRVTHQDGSVQQALVATVAVNRSSTSSSGGPWRGDLVYWGVSVPGERPVAKIELMRRPFTARAPGDTTAGNLRDPAQNITAETFLESAQVVGSYEAGSPPHGGR